MWCPAPVAKDINVLWTHLELELDGEGCPERTMDLGLPVETPIGWKIQLGLEVVELGEEVAVAPGGLGGVGDGHHGGRPEREQAPGCVRERPAFCGRRRDGLGEELRAKFPAQGLAGGFSAMSPTGGGAFADCRERWAA